jgi:hypothetical protein
LDETFVGAPMTGAKAMGLDLTCCALAKELLTASPEVLELVSHAAKNKAIRPPIRGNATRLAPQRAVMTVTRVTGVAPLIFIASRSNVDGKLRYYAPFPIRNP